MIKNDRTWEELIECARWCASPHNIQPWKIKIVSETEAHLFYDPTRLLRDTDPTSRFTILGLGMFIECLNIAAYSYRLEVHAEHEAEQMLDYSYGDPKLFAKLTLHPSAERENEFDAKLIKQRRTSRLHYNGKAVGADVLDSLSSIAHGFGHSFTHTSDSEMVKFIVGLNRETLFLDLDNDKGRTELSGWIRTSVRQAAEKRDGLWSRAMRFPGWVMQNFFFHHERFRNPVLRKILGWVYIRSMKGTRTVGWLRGAFDSRADWVAAGVLLQRLWLEMTKYNVYLHPFGSVVTNPVSHARFISHMGFTENSNDRLWLLMRLGYSDEPPRSYRLTTEEILLPR